MVTLAVAPGVSSLTGRVDPSSTLAGRGTAEFPTTFQSEPSVFMICRPLRPKAITLGSDSAVVALNATGG